VFKDNKIFLLEAAAQGKKQHQLLESFSSRVCTLSAGSVRLLESMFMNLTLSFISLHSPPVLPLRMYQLPLFSIRLDFKSRIWREFGELVLESYNNAPDEIIGISSAISCYKRQYSSELKSLSQFVM